MTLLVQRSQHEDAGSVRHIPPVVRAPAAPPRRAVASLAVDNSRLHTKPGSVTVSRAARATSRSSPPPGLGTTRCTCHLHADNTLLPPSTRPCRSRAHSRSTPRPRTRSASAGTKARGRVRIRRGGGASWLAAALRRYVQARVCRSAPCRPRTAAVVAADGAAGVPCAFASWVRLARS